MLEVRVEVAHPGLLTTVQDAGRTGVAFYGLPRCGWMDPDAARLANLLVGNPETAPLLECNLVPPRLRVLDDCWLAVTGADMGWKLDHTVFQRNRAQPVAAGTELGGSAATDGARGYLAIAGTLRCERVHGSASTDLASGTGGIEGRPLAAGDTLVVEAAMAADSAISAPAVTSYADISHIRCRRGPEWNALAPQTRHAFPDAMFSVSTDSNRMGARLGGPRLVAASETSMASVPVIPGTVQLTPSGRLIVILQDGQSTGGYPRVAIIPEEELGRFNQLRPGQEFRFAFAE